MEVIAFVGPAGTGKSDRALMVAHENKCSCIIDDGILIYRSRIVAGMSAKREASPIAAVRRAIFQNKEDADSVSRALHRISPARVLILGTSDKMVSIITEALAIPAPAKTIRIEDVAGPEEMRRAHDARHLEGKHIIPVPTVELRPQFKGYMIVPIRSFLHKRQGYRGDKSEKSVVRPSFSYYGKLRFGSRVITSLVTYALREMESEMQIRKISGDRTGMEDRNSIIIYLDVALPPGTPQKLRDTVHKIRRLVQKEVEYTTGLTVEKIKIGVTMDVKRRS